MNSTLSLMLNDNHNIVNQHDDYITNQSNDDITNQTNSNIINQTNDDVTNQPNDDITNQTYDDIVNEIDFMSLIKDIARLIVQKEYLGSPLFERNFEIEEFIYNEAIENEIYHCTQFMGHQYNYELYNYLSTKLQILRNGYTPRLN
jgi:hypothetical protein